MVAPVLRPHCSMMILCNQSSRSVPTIELPGSRRPTQITPRPTTPGRSRGLPPPDDRRFPSASSGCRCSISRLLQATSTVPVRTEILLASVRTNESCRRLIKAPKPTGDLGSRRHRFRRKRGPSADGGATLSVARRSDRNGRCGADLMKMIGKVGDEFLAEELQVLGRCALNAFMRRHANQMSRAYCACTRSSDLDSPRRAGARPNA